MSGGPAGVRSDLVATQRKVGMSGIAARSASIGADASGPGTTSPALNSYGCLITGKV